MSEELICAALRGENPYWTEQGNDGFASRFLEQSAYHGIQALLHSVLVGQNGKRGWPEFVLRACHNQATAQAMWEMRHLHLLKKTLAQLSDVGAQAILFKGTALAYEIYSAPFLRPRGDTDLLVPSHMRDKVGLVLERIGFAAEPSEMVGHQASYSWADSAAGMAHTLDLHWRIINSQFLSNLFSYEELRAKAHSLPPLNETAVAVSRVHALALACVHRAIHKQVPYYVDGHACYGGDRLIWLYDIHLLVELLTPSQQHEFLEVVERKGLRTICLEGIELAQARFHTAVPRVVHDALARPGPAEAAARYLNGSAARRLASDFLAVKGVRGKFSFLVKLFFPPESYMRQKYPMARRSWLPSLYVRRIGSRLLAYSTIRRRKGGKHTGLA
jgi:hypothetical protein